MADADAADAIPLTPISVLLLSPSWRADSHGVATVVRSLVNDLWLTDPNRWRIKSE